jgi:hypothetical protein
MRRTAIGAAILALVPAIGAAQTSSFEVVGTRALGMGGAFVAVANDATAVHWNPAGLVHGAPLGMTFEWDRFKTVKHKTPPRPGPTLDTTNFTSLGTWPIGLSYGRFKNTALRSSPAGDLQTEAFTVSQFGVTILQTLVEGLVVGSTIKILRGRPSYGPVSGETVGDALDHGTEIEGSASTTVDLDLGVMADLRKLRVGLTSKNLRSPQFGEIAGIELGLKRRTRLGVAVLPSDGLTFALDVDLDTADPTGGLRRMIALGGESRLGTRAAMRGGVRWSRDGSRRPIGAVGGSVAIRPGFWLDGYYTQARRDEDRGFGFALRAGY